MIPVAPSVASTSSAWTVTSVDFATGSTTGVLVTTAGAGGYAPLLPLKRVPVEKSAIDQRREFLQRQRDHARRPR